jgi:hypothetical protein
MKKQSLFCLILIINCWFEFDHIFFLLDTFHTESEALTTGSIKVSRFFMEVMTKHPKLQQLQKQTRCSTATALAAAAATAPNAMMEHA